VYDEEHWEYRKSLPHHDELAFWRSFKTPSLRNVETNAPDMRNS